MRNPAVAAQGNKERQGGDESCAIGPAPPGRQRLHSLPSSQGGKALERSGASTVADYLSELDLASNTGQREEAQVDRAALEARPNCKEILERERQELLMRWAENTP